MNEEPAEGSRQLTYERMRRVATLLGVDDPSFREQDLGDRVLVILHDGQGEYHMPYRKEAEPA